MQLQIVIVNDYNDGLQVIKMNVIIFYRFPTLFCQKYSQQNYSIRSTDLDRTVQRCVSYY